MIAPFLLLAAATAPTSVVDAELAFARDAQEIGQWTAFRRHADRDAVMFTPKAAWVRDVLADLKDPARSMRWWPTAAYVSCDGRTGVTTGPWLAPDGKTHGYFTTVWQRTAAGWNWVYDGGRRDDGPVPAPSAAKLHSARCAGPHDRAPVLPAKVKDQPASIGSSAGSSGISADKTMHWNWKVGEDGARQLRVFQWNGTNFVQVLADDYPAPKK